MRALSFNRSAKAAASIPVKGIDTLLQMLVRVGSGKSSGSYMGLGLHSLLPLTHLLRGTGGLRGRLVRQSRWGVFS